MTDTASSVMAEGPAPRIWRERKTTGWTIALLSMILGALLFSLIMSWITGQTWEEATRHYGLEAGSHMVTGIFLLAFWEILHRRLLQKHSDEFLEYQLNGRAEQLLGSIKKTLDSNLREIDGRLQQSTHVYVSSVVLIHNALELGVDDIYSHQGGNYTSEMILNAKTLTVAFGSGSRWVGRFNSELSKRLSDPAKVTCFICVHPDSEATDLVPRRLKGMTKDYYVKQIRDTVDVLKRWSKGNPNVKIYGHRLMDSNFTCIGDSEGIFTPKFFTHQSRKAPVLRLSGSSVQQYLNMLASDLEMLKTAEGTVIL